MTTSTAIPGRSVYYTTTSEKLPMGERLYTYLSLSELVSDLEPYDRKEV